MNVTYQGHTAVVKRIPTTLDRRRDITTYSLDNLYPQRVEQIMFRSPIAVGAVDAKNNFIRGEGFENNGDTIINEEHSLTANDILDLIARDYSLYDGFALHFNFDILGNIVDVNYLDFQYVRYGLPDEYGKFHDVKVNTNWEGDSSKSCDNVEKIYTFPLFNPEMLGEDIAKSGDISRFPGQVMYWTGKPNQYPRSSLDSVLDSAQTNGEIQIFELGNIQNGFLGASIMKYQGGFESEAERRKFLEKIALMQGSHNANSIMVVETPDGFEGEILENLPANNNDRLFELTNRNTVNRITQSFGMPPSILGVMPEAGMFNHEQMQESYVYYNNRTRYDRVKVARAFNKWGEFWTDGGLDFGEILVQQFEDGVVDKPKQEPEVIVEEEPVVPEPEPEE